MHLQKGAGMSSESLRMTIYIIAGAYVIITNVIGFAMMGVDKDRSRRNKWRISETSLFVMALLGGSVGTLTGMYFFHHKTAHPAFFIGMPLILILQLALVIWFFAASPFELLII